MVKFAELSHKMVKLFNVERQRVWLGSINGQYPKSIFKLQQ